jgi:plasmid stabilization system protein ParE
MTLVITKADEFTADFAKYFAWYVKEADENVAWRFQCATETALHRIARLPDLGTLRHFRNLMLQELRSFRVDPPFDKILIFYRVRAETLEAWRLIHGARNLSRRLLEPPSTD